MRYFPPQAARVALTSGVPSSVEALPPLPPTHAGGVLLRPVESAVVFLGLGAARGSLSLSFFLSLSLSLDYFTVCLLSTRLIFISFSLSCSSFSFFFFPLLSEKQRK